MNEKEQTLLHVRDTLELHRQGEKTTDEAVETLARVIDNWTLTLHVMQRRGINTLQMTLSASS